MEEEEEEDEEEDEEEEADEAPSPAKRTRSSMKVNAAKNDVTDVNDLPGKICRCEFKSLSKTVLKSIIVPFTESPDEWMSN